MQQTLAEQLADDAPSSTTTMIQKTMPALGSYSALLGQALEPARCLGFLSTHPVTSVQVALSEAHSVAFLSLCAGGMRGCRLESPFGCEGFPHKGGGTHPREAT